MSGFNRLFQRATCPHHADFVQELADIRAYGRANQWHHSSLRELADEADAMVRRGLTAYHVEVLGPGNEGNYQSPDAILVYFAKAWKEIWRPRRLAVVASIVNWNFGAGHGENGTVSICDRRFDNDWFRRILGEVAGLPDAVSGIIVNPVSELACRNRQCRQKGRAWMDIARQMFSGRMLWNGDGDATPLTAPAGWWREWHCSRISDISPGALNATDHSRVLQELGAWHSHCTNLTGLRAMAAKCKEKNAGFSFYHFWTPDDKPDYEAIAAMG